jgi:class 3 adenylate cyclase
MQCVLMLNDLFTMLDEIIAEYDVYKIESLGDAYVVVSGAPQRNEKRHATEIADLALNFVTSVRNFYIPHIPDEKIELRIGVHTGMVVAGVVGTSMPR